MMRLRNRAGFTLVGVLVVLVVIALVAIAFLFVKVNKLENRGQALTTWLGATDGPAANAAGGLTTYLIDLGDKIHDHIELKEPGNTVAHNGSPDNHLDPPPPPNW